MIQTKVQSNTALNEYHGLKVQKYQAMEKDVIYF